MRRAVQCVEQLTQQIVTDFLKGVDLYEVPASMIREAGVLPGPGLRSLDAIHLAAAIRIGVDTFVTYDARLADGARALGLLVLAPA